MRFASLIMLMISISVSAAEHQFYGDVLLRYENETNHVKLPDRERIRAIIHGGLKTKFSDRWSGDIRLSSGLKNKQNVPAITLHRFNTQPKPDTDVFIERLYMKGQWQDTTVFAGKIPWKSQQVTDVFWDRHLSPYGVHIKHQLDPQQSMDFAWFKPLDGQSDTVGNMWLIQWSKRFQAWGGKWTVAPWYVNYDGEDNARYAKKDTAIDNRFIRLSAKARFGAYQFGLDWGRSLENFSHAEFGDFNKDKTSYALEVRHGGLKKIGGYLVQLRYLHVERFAVVTEFAQNAVSRFSTSDFRGLDLRIRRKMGGKWWLGTRISDIRRITENRQEGLRFRIETKYQF